MDWDGCVGSRLGDLDRQADFNGSPFLAVYDDGDAQSTPYTKTDYACPDSLLPLTDNIMSAQIMVGSLKTDGTTYLPSGLAWGWRVLDDDIPFGRPMPGEPRQKALVLMTDGYNTVSREGRKPYIVNDGRYHHGKYEGDESVITTANGITKTLCENIAAQDIEIYTIAYALPASANSDATRTLLRQCAGSTGQFFDAQDSMQLAKAFSAIAEAQAFESNVRLID